MRGRPRNPFMVSARGFRGHTGHGLLSLFPRAELPTLLGTMETSWGSGAEEGAGVGTWILFPPLSLLSAGTLHKPSLSLRVLATDEGSQIK